LVYFPNGFDNDLGVTGNYIELFTYKIIDQEDRIGRLISHTISMTDSAVEPIDISVAISWLDLTSTPKTGNLANITVKVANLVFDPLDPIISQEWEIWDGTSWIFYKTKTTDSEILNLSYLDNKIRLKVVSQFSITAYSNILSYEKSAVDNLFITDVYSDEFGNNFLKVHVEGGTFTGFVNLTGEKDKWAKNAGVDVNLGNPLFIPDAYKIGDIARNSTPITLIEGVHDFNLLMFGVATVPGSNLKGQIGFGYTTIFEESLVSQSFTLIINP